MLVSGVVTQSRSVGRYQFSVEHTAFIFRAEPILSASIIKVAERYGQFTRVNAPNLLIMRSKRSLTTKTTLYFQAKVSLVLRVNKIHYQRGIFQVCELQCLFSDGIYTYTSRFYEITAKFLFRLLKQKLGGCSWGSGLNPRVSFKLWKLEEKNFFHLTSLLPENRF